MVADVVRCLNQFPWTNGVSDTMSPASIVTGVPPPDYHHMKLEFGTYVQVFEASDPTNTPKAQSLGVIALNPTGNTNGDYYFLSLATGACISRHQWTALPMTDTAITRVEALAKFEGQPLIQERGLVVEWRPNHPIDDDEYDRDYDPPREPSANVFDVADYDELEPDELAALLADAVVAQPDGFPLAPIGEAQGALVHDDNAANANENENENENANHNEDFPNIEITDDEDDDYNNGEPGNDDNNNGEQGNPNDDAEEGAPLDEGASLDEEGAPTQPGYNLRHRRPRTDRLRDAMDNPHDRQSYYAPIQLLHQGLDAQYKYVFG